MRRRFALPLLAVVAGVAFSVPAGASVRQIAVGNFYFEDETVGDGRVEARVGDQLRFSVLDGGPGTPHTVDVDELGIHSGSLGSGETFTTPPLGQSGTYVLYCKPHDQRGHKTTLIITAATATPTTAATTTTAAPTTSTTAPTSPTTTTTQSPATQAPATATDPPATTGTRGTTAPSGPVPSSVPTTATTARATSTTTRPTSTTAPAAGPAAPTTVPGAGAVPPPSAADLLAAPDGPVGEAATGDNGGAAALAPVGRGTVDDAAGPAAGSFEELLDRRLRTGRGPWTRSVRLALAALLPMALAAAVALRRWPGNPPRG